MTKPKTVREWANYYNCNHQTIQNLKKQGYDLNKPDDIVRRLSTTIDGYRPPDDFKSSKPTDSKTSNTDQEIGINAAIIRLKKSELKTHNDYIEALDTGSVNAPTLLKTWITTLNALRTVEESITDINEANQNSITKEDLSKDLGTMFKNLSEDLNVMPNKISTLGQHTDKETLHNITEKEVKRILENLRSSKYLNG